MSEKQESSQWNSLVVAKLIASIATPIAVVIAGLVVKEALAKQDHFWHTQDRIIERRFAVYDQISQNLDRISCYVEDVGNWKEETPDSIIRRKRVVDEVMYVNQAVWAPDTFAAYTNYMDTAAFRTRQKSGADALIRADTKQKSALTNWTATWSERFAAPDPEHKQKYNELMKLMSRDLAFDPAQ